ncbi:N-acetyltransferase [bacterium]|nr:N-acetyltransferase [bacterium]MBU3954842.1 N-acetyltransferase [bacterium]MBU4134655.1 N-acetyltransferase [bacterium]
MITRANVQDAKQVYEIIRKHAAKSVVLPRPLASIYEHIREFFVYRIKDRILGIVALHIVWEDMAEVRSLVVDSRHRKKGIGRKLIQQTLEEAAKLNVPNVFALTREEAFFKKAGFKRITKDKLPQKVWNDCINCPLFPDCDEVPVIFNLKKQKLKKS